LVIFLSLAGAGCFPSAQTSSDEQKDPHYVNGRSRVRSQDYKGAIEEFEKALEANPRSASAHFELGWLFEEHIKDYAAAIYHYERHLALRPNSPYADRAKERIKACKMDLAKTEVLGPVTQGMQRDLDRLNTENVLLKRQLEALQAQLASRSTSSITVIAPKPIAAAEVVSPPAGSNVSSNSARVVSAPPREAKPVPSARPRSHIVKSGETIQSIARQYGLKPNLLLAANPQVDPRRLKVGQTLQLPAP